MSKRSGVLVRPHASLGYKPPAPDVFVPTGIVVTTPTLDENLSFAQRVEDLAIKQLVAQAH